MEKYWPGSSSAKCASTGPYLLLTCKRVLVLLEPGDLKLGQVVIKRVAVVELGVNNGSGDRGGCFGIEVWTDTAKLTDMVIARFGDR